MRKIASILKSKGGASLIIVMAIMLLLLITGSSVIMAATTTMSTSVAQAEAENVHRYLAEVARTFDKDIVETKFMNTDGSELGSEQKSKQWYQVPRYVYDKKYDNVSNNITIEIKGLDIKTSDNLWISEDSAENKTEITAKIIEQQLSQRVAYVAEHREPVYDGITNAPLLDAGGNPIYKVIASEVLEERDMKITLNVTFEATYKGKKYVLIAKYRTDAVIERCVGDPRGTCTATDRTTCTESVKNGEFIRGIWMLEGYTKN